MNRALLPVFAALVVACTGSGDELGEVQQALSGPVAAYGFNEGSGATTADSSGNGLNGTLLNGAAWTTSGKNGNAIAFSGTSEVRIADAPLLRLTTGMTIEAWVNPTVNTGWHPVLAKEGATPLWDYTLYAIGSNRPDVLYMHGGEIELAGGTQFAKNVWAHLAATFDGQVLRLYQNGTQVATKNTTASIDTSSKPLHIGADTDGPSYFAGKIDDVRIYSRALSAAEIVTDMNTAVGQPTDAGGSQEAAAEAQVEAAVDASPDMVPEAEASNDAAPEVAADGEAGLDAADEPEAEAAADVAVDASVEADAGSDVSQELEAGSSQEAGASIFPLHVSANGHYFVDNTGVPFLLHGDAAWSLESNTTTEEAELYLADRQSRGFNAIIMEAMEHRFVSPTSRAPKNVYGNGPFSTPGDFSTPNEVYWAHVDDVLRRADSHGIVVFITPAYLGFPQEGWWTEMQSNGVAKMSGYGQFLGNRYKNQPNIVWMHGGDASPTAPSDKALVDAIATGIQSTGDTHLHTAHNSFNSTSSQVWGSYSWLGIEGMYGYEGDWNAWQVAQAAYQRTPVRPVVLLESGYDGEGIGAPVPFIQRRTIWYTYVGGGVGQFFGNNPIWFFGSKPSDGNAGWADGTRYYSSWQSALGGSLVNPSLATVKQVLSTRHWEKLVPDLSHAFYTGEFGIYPTIHALGALASDGSWGIAYAADVFNMSANLGVFSHPVTAKWIDPTNGAVTLIGTFTNSGTFTRHVPTGGNAGHDTDWVLVFE